MAGQEKAGKGQLSLSEIVQGATQPNGSASFSDIVQNPPQPPSSDQPGFFRRTLQSIGLPSNQQELEAAQPTLADKIGGPPLMAGKMVYNYGKNVYDQMAKATATRQQAQKNISAGQPIIPNVANALAGEIEGVARGPLAPVGGNIVMNAAEDIGNKNYSGVAGDVLGGLINAYLLRRSGGPSDTTRVNKLAYATGGESQALEHTLNDLRSASAATPPQTVGDLLNTVKQAKTNLINESGLAMQPIRGKQIVPIGIADRIKSLIRPDDVMTAEGRQKIAYLNKVAADYQKPWDVEQLDSARIQAEKRLNPFYKKGISDQYAGRGTNIGVPIDEAIIQGSQDSVYPAMDQAAGKPSGYFRNLKQRHGNLIQLEDALTDRVRELEDQTAVAQGAPRFSKENLSVFGHPTGPPGFSVHRLQNVFIKPNPIGSANAAVAKGFAGGGLPSTGAVYSLPARYVLFPGNEQEQPQPQPGPNLLRQRLSDIAGQ